MLLELTLTRSMRCRSAGEAVSERRRPVEAVLVGQLAGWLVGGARQHRQQGSQAAAAAAAAQYTARPGRTWKSNTKRCSEKQSMGGSARSCSWRDAVTCASSERSEAGRASELARGGSSLLARMCCSAESALPLHRPCTAPRTAPVPPPYRHRTAPVPSWRSTRTGSCWRPPSTRAPSGCPATLRGGVKQRAGGHGG